jgi:hypothetical protein
MEIFPQSMSIQRLVSSKTEQPADQAGAAAQAVSQGGNGFTMMGQKVEEEAQPLSPKDLLVHGWCNEESSRRKHSWSLSLWAPYLRIQ